MNIAILEKYKDIPEIYNNFMFREIIKNLRKYTQNLNIIFDSNVPKSNRNIELSWVFDDFSFGSVLNPITKEIVRYDADEFDKGNQLIVSTSNAFTCTNCGARNVYTISSTEVHVKHEDKECFDYKDFTLEIEVPEDGKMVMNDYLGNILTDTDKFVSINNEYGKYYKSKDAESKGFLHFFVSNTCPSVLQLEDGTILIGRSSSFCTEESDYEVIDTEKYPNSVQLGYICTDLWWTTISSVKHCKELQKSGKKYRKGDEFSMEPGKWECTVHAVEDYYSNEIFATIKKVKS